MAFDFMMINRGHMLQAGPNCKTQNYKVQLYCRRRSPACFILIPLLFLLLCFTANKLVYINYHKREGASTIEDSNPCLLRASSYDQLEPFVPTENLLLLPSRKEAKRRSNQEEKEEEIKGHITGINYAGKKLHYHKASTSFPKACRGKLIYIYPLPAEFNKELVERCRVGYKRYCDKWFCIPCNRLENHGFGPRVPHNQTMVNKGVSEEDEGVRLIPSKAWYRSDQFSVEVIFYEKMKRHVCVTKDADEANAFYIPFYGGLDVGFISFSSHTHIRDELTQRLVGWLSGNPIWQAKKEAPHFMVLGHVAWDFNRKRLEGDGLYDDGSHTWGTSLFHQPLLSNVTFLLIERKVTKHDMGLPFPTLFHPSSTNDIFLWQEEVRKAKRPWLVTFVGGSTRNFSSGDVTRTLRRELMMQCKDAEMGTLTNVESMRRCRAVECISIEEMTKLRKKLEVHNTGESGVIENKIACDEEPEEVVRALAKSVFCLQPKGDSFTRKGFFDTIVAGCIPVLFSNGTAYYQYKWHLPPSPSLYSVFIPEADVLANHVNVVDILSGIPSARIKSMQHAVRHLIPHIVYSPPSSSLQDAFSITLDAFFMHNNA